MCDLSMKESMEQDVKESTRWKHTHPKYWTSADILDFVYYYADKEKIPMRNFRGEKFGSMDGSSLCKMSRTDFVEIDENFGGRLYSFLQSYINSAEKEQRMSQMVVSEWHRKHPELWTNKEVLDWIFDVAQLCNVNFRTFNGERFQNVSGVDLCRMSRNEFIRREPEHGSKMYGALQQVLKECNFVPPDDLQGDVQLCSLSPAEISSLKQELYPSFSEHILYDMDEYRRESPEQIVPSLIPSTVETLSNPKRGFEEPELYPPGHEALSCSPAKKIKTRTSRVVSTELPRVSNFNKDGGVIKPRPKMRLWKFMRDLLDDPKYNPEYIRWEHKEEGIFRIVSGKSKAIAELWGKIKNNPNMTFDKLGRSLRWCRANNGNFESIPKGETSLPKKLCFRFKQCDL